MDAVAVSHVALSVTSLQRSARFYSATFGFEPSPSTYRGRGRRLSQLMGIPDCDLRGLFLRHGSTFLELLEYDAPRRAREPVRDDDIGLAHLSFIVEDAQAVGSAAEENGGTTLWDSFVELAFGEADPVTIGFCADPDANRIELVQHPDPAARDRHAAFLGAGELGWPAHTFRRAS